MKKFYLLLLVFFSLGVFAQKGFHLGVIGGPYLSAQLNKQDFDNADVRYDGIYISGAGGITFNYHFNDKIGLGTQLLFASQGFKYHDRLGTKYSRKVSYIKIPLLFHVNSPSDKLVGGYFYIGPQFSFLIAKDYVGSNTSDSAYAGLHKAFTIGGAMGFGIQFNLLDGKLQLNAGLRLDGDFTDAYKGKELVGDQLINGKYREFDNTIYVFATDPDDGNRSPTHNVAGMIEIGIKYVFRKK